MRSSSSGGANMRSLIIATLLLSACVVMAQGQTTTTTTTSASVETGGATSFQGSSLEDLQKQIVASTQSAIEAIEANPTDLTTALQNLLNVLAQSLLNALVSILQSGEIDAEAQANDISTVVGQALGSIASSATGPLSDLDVASIQAEINQNVTKILSEAGSDADTSALITSVGESVLQTVSNALATTLGLSSFQASIQLGGIETATTTTTQSANASFEISGRSSEELQQQLVEATQQAVAALEANPNDLNSALQNLLQALAGSLAQVLITIVQGGSLDAAVQSEQISAVVGDALTVITANATGGLSTLDVPAVQAEIKANVSSIINNLPENASQTAVVQDIGEAVLTIIGNSIAGALGLSSFTSSISFTFSSSETTSTSGGSFALQQVQSNVDGQGGIIINLLLAGNITGAQAEFEKLLLSGGSAEVENLFAQACDNPELFDQLFKMLTSVYNDASFNVLPLSVQYETIYKINSTCLTDLLGQVIIELSSSGASAPGLQQALTFAFTSQTGDVRKTFDEAIKSAKDQIGCVGVGPIILNSYDNAGQFSSLFNIAVQQNPLLQECLQVAQNFQVTANIVTQISNPQEAAGSITAGLAVGNISSVSLALSQALDTGLTENLTTTITLLFGEQDIDFGNLALAITTAFNETTTDTSNASLIITNALEESLLTVNVSILAGFLETGLENDTTEEQFSQIIKGSISASGCGLLDVVDEVAKNAEESNNTKIIDVITNDSELQKCVPQITLDKIIPPQISVFPPPPSPRASTSILEFSPPTPIIQQILGFLEVAPEPEAEVEIDVPMDDLEEDFPPLIVFPTPVVFLPAPEPEVEDDDMEDTPVPVVDDLEEQVFVPMPAPEVEVSSPPPPPPTPVQSPPPLSPPPVSPPMSPPPSPMPSPPPPPSPLPSPIPSPSPKVCPPVRKELLLELFNGKQYYFGDHLMYEEAVEVCDCIDGHLVIVNDEAEELLVAAGHELKRMQLAIIGESDKMWQFWIGLTNPTGEQSEEAWQWADGSPIAYVNWRWDEPTYLIDGKKPENCAEIDANYEDCYGVKVRKYVAWETDNCYELRSYICEVAIQPRLENIASQVEFLYVAPLDRSYVYLKEKSYSYSSAKQACEYMKGQMVIFRNRVEEDLVYGALASVLPDFKTTPVWIGLEREQPECGYDCGCSCNGQPECGCSCGGCELQQGEFKWVSGKALGNYVNWMGQPCGAVDAECIPAGQCVLTWVKKTPDTIDGSWTPVQDCGLMAHTICEVQGVYYP